MCGNDAESRFLNQRNRDGLTVGHVDENEQEILCDDLLLLIILHDSFPFIGQLGQERAFRVQIGLTPQCISPFVSTKLSQ